MSNDEAVYSNVVDNGGCPSIVPRIWLQCEELRGRTPFISIRDGRGKVLAMTLVFMSFESSMTGYETQEPLDAFSFFFLQV